MRKVLVSYLWMAVLVAGCAAFAAPKSFDQKLAYAYSTHTAIVQAATSSLSAGTLSVSDAEAVQKLATQSRAVLDSAKLAAGTGDVTTAEGQLALAVNILTQLQDFLRTRTKP